MNLKKTQSPQKTIKKEETIGDLMYIIGGPPYEGGVERESHQNKDQNQGLIWGILGG